MEIPLPRTLPPLAAAPPSPFLIATLRAAIAIPVLYYGVQLLAAPFYPGYSFIKQAASELGSDLCSQAHMFNYGIMAQGVLALLAAIAFFRAMQRVGVHPILYCLTAAALALNGVQSFWAGWFPMPDPRHGGHPAFIIGMLALPFLLLASLWKLGGTPLRIYLIATITLLLIMVPFMSGMINLSAYEVRGLLQRVFTLAIFPPIGVGAWVLSTRLVRDQR